MMKASQFSDDKSWKEKKIKKGLNLGCSYACRGELSWPVPFDSALDHFYTYETHFKSVTD